MYKKHCNPSHCQKWIPTGRTFKHVGLIWIPTGKLLNNGQAMVDFETLKCLDKTVTNLYIGSQNCDVSAGTPNSVAGTSSSHRVIRHKIWRPKINNIPMTGNSIPHP